MNEIIPIMQMTADGFTRQSIAYHLKISKRTVDERVMKELKVQNVNNQYELLALFFRRKLIKVIIFIFILSNVSCKSTSGCFNQTQTKIIKGGKRISF